MPDSSDSYTIPQMTMTPMADGRVLLKTGLGGSRQTAKIPRVAARAAIRCLNFVIPEWLWSEKDPK